MSFVLLLDLAHLFTNLMGFFYNFGGFLLFLVLCKKSGKNTRMSYYSPRMHTKFSVSQPSNFRLFTGHILSHNLTCTFNGIVTNLKVEYNTKIQMSTGVFWIQLHRYLKTLFRKRKSLLHFLSRKDNIDMVHVRCEGKKNKKKST